MQLTNNQKSYFGGKGQDGVYHAIINQIPLHDVYIEPFLGGGSIMKRKRPAKVNIGVEINGSAAGDFDGPPGTIVKNTCGIHFLSTIDKNTYPASSVFVYCDPPYPHSTRGKTRYQNEFSEDDHFSLLKTLVASPFQIAISTYPNEMYSGFLHNWRKVEYKATTRSGRQVVENLFMNYPKPVILHDDRYIGKDAGNRQDIKRRIERTKKRLLSWDGYERVKLLEQVLKSIPDREREYLSDIMQVYIPGGDGKVAFTSRNSN
jgi:hypothetical protein